MPNAYGFSLDKVKQRVKGFIDGLSSSEIKEGNYPKAKDELLVAAWGRQMFDQAKAFRNAVFESTQDSRFQYSDPIKWGKMINAIESGNHWLAFGSRKVDSNGKEEKWKSEMVDDETSDQLRVRNAHLTAEWHDVQVMPNIENINDILDEDRKTTGWGKFVRRYVKNAQYYGMAWAQSYLDKSNDQRGIANERVLLYGSVFLSPYAYGKEKAEGCWYICVSEMCTGQWVRENIPGFDISRTSQAGRDASKDITIRTSTNRTYELTKQYERIEIDCDDPTTEATPFDKAVFDEKLAALLQGQEVPVDEYEDNHKKYVIAYHDYVDELVAFAQKQILAGGFTPQDDQILADNIDIINMQIDLHIAEAVKSQYPEGRRAKYPFGRHIILIDGIVAYDEPNEYGFDWRNRYHELKNEEVPNRFDGRGDVEIMWNAQRGLDENLSRFTDAALVSGIPKKQRHISDREFIEKQGGENNDPTQPDYYATVPATWQKAPPPTEQLELYRIQKENAAKKGGVDKVARGQAPTTNASGDLAEALISQNEIIITGELSSNLNDVVEDIIETKLMIMKKFYTEPRVYPIQGSPQVVVVAQILSSITVLGEGGMETEQEIDRFEVTAVPGSNHPQKWEREMALFSSLATRTFPDGTPLIPMEAVQDKLAEKYPQFGRNGKYYTVSKATAIGMQVLKAQAAQAQIVQGVQKKQNVDAVKNKFLAKQGLPQPSTNGTEIPPMSIN